MLLISSAKSRVRGHLRLYLAYVPENEDEEQTGEEEEQRQTDEVIL